MLATRTLLVCGLFLSSHVVPILGQERTPSSKDNAAKAENPPFPLVVRIDNKALDPLREKDIKHQGSVDRVILGTQAIGSSWTTGGVNVKIIPQQSDASIIIRFHGNTRTKTTGYNGPAIIYSHTDTEFECARQVVFEPRIGLVAGKPTVAARTTLAYDGFDANRRLGRRLISRVAEQRAGELLEQARAIAHQQNKSEVCQAFEKRLDAQLAAINSRLDIARYVNALFGPNFKPNLVASSCEDCILVGIGKQANSSKLAELLPDRKKPLPIEIWVHSSMLGEQLAGMATVAEKIENYVVPTALQLQVLQVVMGAAPSPERTFEVSFQQGWLVIGLQNEPAVSNVAVLGL
jgi:hypothetical protein